MTDQIIFPCSRRCNGPPKRGMLNKMMPYIPQSLPSDYLEFIKRHNGGWCGGVNLWGISEVVENNFNDRLPLFPKDFFMFGSTDEEFYGFDVRPSCRMAILSIAGNAADWDCALYQAPTFLEFMRLEALADEWDEANDKLLDAAVDELIAAGKASEPFPPAASLASAVPVAERGFMGLVKRFLAPRR